MKCVEREWSEWREKSEWSEFREKFCLSSGLKSGSKILNNHSGS